MTDQPYGGGQRQGYGAGQPPGYAAGQPPGYGPGQPPGPGTGQPQYAPPPAGGGASFPPPPTAAYPAAPQAAADSKGFLGSLFDFSFTAFVTPKIVRVIYVLIATLAGLSTLGFVISAFASSMLFGLIALLILGPLFFLITLALWRMILEVFMILFRIADHLKAIREQGGDR